MKWLRRLGIAVGMLVLIVIIAVGTVFAVTERHFNRDWSQIKGKTLTVSSDSITVTRGAHLARAVGKCVDCHGETLGGKRFIDDPALGLVVASNITTGKGGVLAKYDNAALERVLRHGVKWDGKGARIMPAHEFSYFADDDLAAIIAYVRSVPAVDNELPPTDLKLLARVLNVAGQFPMLDVERIDHARVSPATMPFAPTVEYGQYSMRVGGCFACHGETLSGGKIPGVPPEWPPAANLTPTGLVAYKSEADFVKLLRTGMRPSGSPVNNVMPWQYAKDLTDDEIHAIWLYLQTVPKKEFGGR